MIKDEGTTPDCAGRGLGLYCSKLQGGEEKAQITNFKGKITYFKNEGHAGLKEACSTRWSQAGGGSRQQLAAY